MKHACSRVLQSELQNPQLTLLVTLRPAKPNYVCNLHLSWTEKSTEKNNSSIKEKKYYILN